MMLVEISKEISEENGSFTSGFYVLGKYSIACLLLWFLPEFHGWSEVGED